MGSGASVMRACAVAPLMRPMAPDLAWPEPQRMGGAVNGSAWIAGGLGYAVVAAAPQDEITEISRLVRQQSPA